MERGKKLNDTYTLIDEIGSGGGGVVYRAYHERLKTYVVVKKIKEKVKGILDGRAEADILKKIKHTYLPRVYDFLEIDGEIYTVMDYIPGKSLDKALAEEGRFPPKQVLAWAEELAEALEYLHNQNPPVVHSDIKPANIMLTPEGKICLIDFNISLAFDSGMKTSTGISGGYSPPEQYPNLARYRQFAEERKKPSFQEETRTMTSGRGAATVTADAGFADRGETATVTATADSRTEAGRTETATADSRTEAGRTETATANGRMEAGRTETVGADGRTEVGQSRPAGAGRTETAETETEAGRTIRGTVGRGVDERSDIYSLGATLYHLVTGIKPGRDFEQIVPIDQCGTELSEGFVHILQKMMELRPEDRYQNGGELLHAFRHIYELDTEYQNYRKRRRNRKLLTGVLYLTGAALLGSGWAVRQREKDTAYNRGMEQAEACMAEGSFDEAFAVLSSAMEIRPERIEAYGSETLRLYQTGSYDDCIRYAVDILLNPAYRVEDEKDRSVLGDIYYVLGNCYMEKEDYSNAELNLKNAIDQYSQNSLYYRDYAITLAKQGRVQEAESVLEQATALHLGEDSIYMVQGEIAFAKGDQKAAQEYLLRAVSAAEDDQLRKRAVLLCDRIYRELGTAYIDQEIGLLEQEENRFGGAASAMNLSERLADAYARKAEADESVRQEYYEKALERFEYLYENGYSTRQMMENIAILYEQMDQYNEAEDMLMQMLEKYPDSYAVYKRLAYLEADQQQNKENADRDYRQMKEYADRAMELYDDQGQDQEMQMLKQMLVDLADGGWL